MKYTQCQFFINADLKSKGDKTSKLQINFVDGKQNVFEDMLNFGLSTIDTRSKIENSSNECYLNCKKSKLNFKLAILKNRKLEHVYSKNDLDHISFHKDDGYINIHKADKSLKDKIITIKTGLPNREESEKQSFTIIQFKIPYSIIFSMLNIPEENYKNTGIYGYDVAYFAINYGEEGKYNSIYNNEYPLIRSINSSNVLRLLVNLNSSISIFNETVNGNEQTNLQEFREEFNALQDNAYQIFEEETYPEMMKQLDLDDFEATKLLKQIPRDSWFSISPFGINIIDRNFDDPHAIIWFE